MLKLMDDPDRFDQFNDEDKAAIRKMASGVSFFAKIRFDTCTRLFGGAAFRI